MYNKGDICRNVYTTTLQRSILKNKNLVSRFVYINFNFLWLIRVFSLIPKGEIVGIKLLFPLVTTLIHTNDATKLKAQFPTSTKHSRVNQVIAVYTEQNRDYQVDTCNVKTNNCYCASQCLPSSQLV